MMVVFDLASSSPCSCVSAVFAWSDNLFHFWMVSSSLVCASVWTDLAGLYAWLAIHVVKLAPSSALFDVLTTALNLSMAPIWAVSCPCMALVTAIDTAKIGST